MDYTFEEWILTVKQILIDVWEVDEPIDEEYWKESYYKLNIKPDRAVVYETSFI